MALRKLCSSWQAVVRPGLLNSFTRAASSAPSVYDKIIDVTVIDMAGRHHTLRALEGQNLAEVLEAHVDTLGDSVIVGSPEGRHVFDSHVKVPNELVSRIPPPVGDDARALSEVAKPGTVDKQHSRLASSIVLDRSMNGSLVALGENNYWKTL